MLQILFVRCDYSIDLVWPLVDIPLGFDNERGPKCQVALPLPLPVRLSRRALLFEQSSKRPETLVWQLFARFPETESLVEPPQRTLRHRLARPIVRFVGRDAMRNADWFECNGPGLPVPIQKTVSWRSLPVCGVYRGIPLSACMLRVTWSMTQQRLNWPTRYVITI
jgi:hypothetical protein